MYKIIFSLILLCGTMGYAQNDSIKNKRNNMKTLNIENYKSMQFDDRISTARSPIDTHYRNGLELINVIHHDDLIIVKTKNENTPYVKIETYSEDTKVMIEEGQSFSGLNYGIWKRYDAKGNLIEEINYDKNYKFPINDLIEKMREEHDVDILDKYRVSTYRVFNDVLNRSFYTLTVRPFQGAEQFTSYIVDGNTGATLIQKNMWAGDKSLYKEYLEILEKK